jgi:hypothetical protein
VVEHWTVNPEEEAGRFSKNAHSLEVMMDPLDRRVALGRNGQPAFVLRTSLCWATAPRSRPFERIG